MQSRFENVINGLCWRMGVATAGLIKRLVERLEVLVHRFKEGKQLFNRLFRKEAHEHLGDWGRKQLINWLFPA